MPTPAVPKRITRWQTLSGLLAVAIVAVGATLSGDVAQGRVAPPDGQPTAQQLDPNTIAIVTGGGTVQADPTTVASFGLNAKRPAGFIQNGTGAAQGRINYDKHAQLAGRHVNVPVTFMNAEIAATQTPNHTGGRAQLVGDCTQPGAECPSATPSYQSVLVYVEDNADSGAGSDKFEIFYCTSAASVTVISPTCPLFDTLVFLRTGNIQIRTNDSGNGGGSAPTAVRAPIRKP